MFIKNIVIVDDDKHIRDRIHSHIIESSLGLKFVLIKAENGEEALRFLKFLIKDRQGIALIISDMEMPILDGIGLIKEIKLNPNLENIPILVLSSVNDKTKVIDAIQAGANNYLLKPWVKEDLIKKINTCLEL